MSSAEHANIKNKTSSSTLVIDTVEQVECLSRWIECFCVVNFDLELGQKLETVYPISYTLPDDVAMDICYLSFPDSHAGPLKRSPYTIRILLGDRFLFGCVYFCQERNVSLSRGYMQKSLVLLSHRPFPELFANVMKVIGSAFFEDHSQESMEVLKAAVIGINKWPPPVPNTDYALPFMGTIFEYHTPHFTRHHANSISPSSPSSSANDSGTSMMVHSQGTSKESVSPVTGLKARLSGRKYPFQEIGLYRVFGHRVTDLWRCWELMMLGEPILILSQHPTDCSNAVLALLSLIAPLSYAGDWRPYFTVHDSSFQRFSMMGKHINFKSAVLGVTNPFFIKSFESWPHVISIDDRSSASSMPRSSSSPTLSSSNGLRSKLLMKRTESRDALVGDFQERFFTTHKCVLQEDSDVLDQLLSGKSSVEVEMNNNRLRKYFEQLTEDFMHPVHSYFDLLWCSLKWPMTCSDNVRMLSPKKFLAHIKKVGFKKNLFNVKHTQVMKFYEQFLHSSTFKLWLDNRIQEADQELKSAHEATRQHQQNPTEDQEGKTPEVNAQDAKES